MKVAFIGYRTDILEFYYSENVNMFNLAEELSFLGVEVHYYGGTREKKISETFSMIPYQEFWKRMKDYDWYYLLSIHGFRTMKYFDVKRWDRCYAKHFTISNPGESWYDIESLFFHECRFFDVTTTNAKHFAEKRFGKVGNLINSENAAFYNLPLISDNSPYIKSGKPIVTYIGSAIDSQLQIINKLSELLYREVDLYFLSFQSFSELSKKYLISGKVKILPKVQNDSVWRYYFHSDAGFGLNIGEPHKFSPSDNKSCKNDLAKIYHTLRLGIPMVVPDNVSNFKLVDDFQFGRITRTNNGKIDIEDMAKKIIEVSKIRKKCPRMGRIIREKHSYKQRALELFKRLSS